MMKNRGKKSFALLGGVMMLLNMALPGFTYAGGESASSVVLEVKVMPYEPDLDLRLESWRDLCESPIFKVACAVGNDQCPDQCKDGGSDFQWEDITDKGPSFTVQDEKYKMSYLDSNFTKMRVKLEKDGEEFTKEFTPSDIEADIIKVDLSSTVNRLKELKPLAQSNFEVNYNTSEEDAKKVLPSKATITDTAEAEHQVDLTWTVDGYKADIAGDYTATAHFTLPEGVKQSKPETELQYIAKITVKADPLVEKKAKVDALKILVDNQVELAEQVVYVGKNGMNSLNWSNETPLGELEPQACILKGADEALYDRHAGSGDTFNESFAKCSGLLTQSKYRSYAFPEQQYTLTVDFGDEIKKVYAFSFKKMLDIDWKTDYDPTQSTNEMVKNYYVARSGTPLVDVKEGMEFVPGSPAKYHHLMFLYKVNNLQGAEKTRYEIRLNDNKGDVIAYGHREQVKALDGFVWSFRDWRADPQFKVEDIDQYRGGPAGLTVVEARNDDILKVGTKIVFIVKVKYADREETIEYPYTITQQDVVKASIGEKITLTFKDGDQELSKQVLLSGTAAIMPANPTKSRHTFLGWTTDKEGKQKFDATTKLAVDTVLYAQWRKKSSSSSSSGGGGGSYSVSSSTPSSTNTKKTEDKKIETEKVKTSDREQAIARLLTSKDVNHIFSGTFEAAEGNIARQSELREMHQSLMKESNEELRKAYLYAYLRGMTTMPTIEKADLHRGLTRAEMAKMMVVYATKALNKTAQKTDTPKYADVDRNLGDLPGYITLAYQLGIMGIDAQGKALANFDPNKEVTRAEFATVLSRVLFGDTYNAVGANWAEAHLHALKTAGIIKDTTASMKELRGWVMLMLMRSEGVR